MCSYYLEPKGVATDRTTAPTTDSLARALDGLHAIRNGVVIEVLRKIVEYDSREAWREDGVCSMVDWLAYRYGLLHRTATELVRVALALQDLPAIAEAFADGRLSWDKVVLLTTVATPEDDAEWAEWAECHNASFVQRAVQHRRRITRVETAETLRNRYVRSRWDSNEGVLHLNARLPGAEGAVVAKALERATERIPAKVDGTYQPHWQRSADALVQIFSAQIAEDSDGERATVVLHVDVRDLNRINGTATIEDDPSVSAEVARRLACDARLQLVVDGPNGELLGVGRTTRTVPPWLAREIRRRDKGCRFADCGRTCGTQIHHVHHWAHGGRTDIDNLLTLCRYHHRAVHDEGFRLIKDSLGRVRFVRPDGRPLPLRPISLRPWVHERMFGPAPPERVA